MIGKFLFEEVLLIKTCTLKPILSMQGTVTTRIRYSDTITTIKKCLLNDWSQACSAQEKLITKSDNTAESTNILKCKVGTRQSVDVTSHLEANVVQRMNASSN